MDTHLPAPPAPVPPSAAPSVATDRRDVDGRLARTYQSAWVLPAHIAVLALAALVYIFNLNVSGYANTFYSMAAQAASQSWSAWFWGSLDASNFITVDKPPLGTMLMGLSVRVFGLSSWSILLPEALCGVATVAVLYAIMRRRSGPVAATIAALVATLTPAAVLMFRYNNPDALLTLLLVLAAWAFLRGLEDGRLRWVVLTALFVGLAFNTKFLQAYLVLPAFAIVYLIAAPISLRKRLVALAVAVVGVLVFSGWWVLAVQLVPAGMRPYVGGSTDGTALQLLFGYDGLGRIFGELTGNAQRAEITNLPFGPSAAFSGPPGLLRLFNRELGGQIAWLLPFATIGAVSSLFVRRHRPRTDLSRAAVLMWSLWLITHVLVFSLMGGIIHSYYVVVMAPAIGALVGTGTVDLWRARRTNRRLAGLALSAAVGSTALLGWELLNRTPDFLPGFSTLVLVIGGCAAAIIAIASVLPADTDEATLKTATTMILVATTLGMIAVLAGPAAYTLDTMTTSYQGGDPSAGPSSVRAVFGGPPGRPPPGRPDGVPIPAGGLLGRTPGGLDDADLQYLVANRGDALWIVAASASSQAAPIQLATGQPVMAMGGFNGSDAAPTLEQLQRYISNGQLRFVIASSSGAGSFGLGFGYASGISTWARGHCHPVIVSGGSATNVYDCAGAA